MAGLPLPGVQPRFQQMAQGHMGGAVGAYGALTKDTAPKDPGPTAGGAIGAGVGGLAAGASVGSMFPGVGTAVGAVAGFVIGMGSYLLS